MSIYGGGKSRISEEAGNDFERSLKFSRFFVVHASRCVWLSATMQW